MINNWKYVCIVHVHEPVHKIHLPEHINQVQCLTAHKLHHIHEVAENQRVIRKIATFRKKHQNPMCSDMWDFPILFREAVIYVLADFAR